MLAPVRQIVQETPSVKTFIMDLKVSFKPGQYMIYKFPGEDAGRSFSICRSPTEGDVGFTTVIRESDFKQRLNSLKAGDMLECQGPYGHFTIEENLNKPIFMIAAGVGISPFRSMLRWAMDTEFPIQMKVLHSVKTRDDMIYREEIEEWQEGDKFTYIPTLTQEEPTDWEGEIGRVNPGMIKRHAERDSIFYVCGSPRFVESVVEMLLQTGIPEDLIRYEMYAGY